MCRSKGTIASCARDKTLEIERESIERNLAALGTKPSDSGRIYKLLGLLPLRHRRQMSEELTVGALLLDDVCNPSRKREQVA
eukprot:3417990-Amphidinium_carterae.9